MRERVNERNVWDKLSESAHEMKKLKFALRQTSWVAFNKISRQKSHVYPRAVFREREICAPFITRTRAGRERAVMIARIRSGAHVQRDRKFCMHSWLAACNGGTIDRARYACSDAALLRGSRRWTGREFTARVIRAWYVLCSDKRRASCADFGP
jgi:hypothetical protein